MDHARHRAERRNAARWFAAGGVAGALLSGVAVVALVQVIGGPTQDASGPGPVGAGQPTSHQFGARATRSDRSQYLTPPPRVQASSPATGLNEPVHLLGDSLAVGIAPYVEAGLGDRPLTIDAAEGRGTATMVALLGPYAATSAPTWVVSLGTNDNPEDFPEQAAAVMEYAGPGRCVVWFDIWRLGTDEAINATLTRLAVQHPNLHVIAWHDVADAHPEWFSGTDVHPSTAGYAVRGQLAVDAVTQECGADP